MSLGKTEVPHLDIALLIRTADGELPEAELLSAQRHLAACSKCRRVLAQITEVSEQLDTLVSSTSAPTPLADRQRLARRLKAPAPAPGAAAWSADRNAGFILRRFGWSMAIAATVALGIVVASHGRKAPKISDHPAPAQSSALEIDGESFIPLPYSNPDLPVNTSRVVEMRVPVSSLSDAGIVFEPVAAGYRAADRTVLADVLIGTDGQPLGVHILSVE